MTLVALILIPFFGGILAWLLGRSQPGAARVIALIAMAIDLVLALILWAQFSGRPNADQPWFVTLQAPWVPQLGISLQLALDGISLVMVLLTAFLGIVAIAAAWNQITQSVGLFYFNLLWTLAATMGVFVALDLFLFYFFWELMIVPMFFLIVLWGGEGRTAAGLRFFIFTQVGGLLMLVAIVGLYLAHGQATGVYTFDYFQLLGTPISPVLATWLMLGFFVGFAVKIPVVPVHSWLPDAYTQSPVAGVIVLAGLLAKTGAYGLMRFVVPLFPDASAAFAPVAMALAVAGVLYGALLAFGQVDAKRLLAFASLSHMSLITLGIFAFTQIALQGVVLQIVSHGIVLGALFMIVGAVEARFGTRDLRRLGGLWSAAPRLSAISLVFVLALMGLPGLGSFVGEFLLLLGTFSVQTVFAVIAALGVVLAVIYSLWLFQRVFQGTFQEATASEPRRVLDLSAREFVTLAAMVVIIVWLGLYPQPVFDTAEQAVTNLRQSAVVSRPVELTAAPAGLATPLFNSILPAQDQSETR